MIIVKKRMMIIYKKHQTYSFISFIKLIQTDIFQWLSLIFNDFSKQDAIFPGQHEIQWLFKARLKFNDFS